MRAAPLPCLLALVLAGCSPDLWWSPDQQGRRAMERGDPARAAKLFEDPEWRAVACYRAGDLACAADGFALSDTPEAWLGLGNARARGDALEDALAAYERALALRPGWPPAEQNRDVVAAVLAARAAAEEDEEEGEAAPPPTFDADEVKFDEKGKKGSLGEVPEMGAREVVEEIWLRNLKSDPGDFLRLRFRAEARAASAPTGEDG